MCLDDGDGTEMKGKRVLWPVNSNKMEVGWGDNLGSDRKRSWMRGQGICYSPHTLGVQFSFGTEDDPLLLYFSKRNLKWVCQFSSVAQFCPTLFDPMDCSMPGLPVHHQILESTQTHVHWVGDAIEPSHPLLSPSPPAFNLSHHQSLFQWVSSSHQVAKVFEFQLQHQSLQWTLWTDLL